MFRQLIRTMAQNPVGRSAVTQSFAHLISRRVMTTSSESTNKFFNLVHELNQHPSYQVQGKSHLEARNHIISSVSLSEIIKTKKQLFDLLRLLNSDERQLLFKQLG